MRSTKSSVRSRAAEYGGLLPAAVLLGGCFGFALVLTVLYSFWQVVDFEVVPDWTLENYRYFFTVDTYVRTFVATLAMVTVATALTLAVAVPFAYWLTRYVSRRWRRRLLIVVVLPFFASYLLRVYAWLGILGQNGAIKVPSTASCRPSGSRTSRCRSCSSTGRPSCWCSSICTSRSRYWRSTSRWSSSTGAR
jgi:ABC-type spermidine/putrescine transport system permease subunit I